MCRKSWRDIRIVYAKLQIENRVTREYFHQSYCSWFTSSGITVHMYLEHKKCISWIPLNPNQKHNINTFSKSSWYNLSILQRFGKVSTYTWRKLTKCYCLLRRWNWSFSLCTSLWLFSFTSPTLKMRPSEYSFSLMHTYPQNKNKGWEWKLRLWIEILWIFMA